jgi:hypothetical protein
VAVVIAGGDAGAIAQTIFDKKGPGTGTYGSTTEAVLDPFGVPKTVDFSRPTVVDMWVEIRIHPLASYTSAIGEALQQAVVDYGNGLDIGADVITTRLYLPANLFGAVDSATYEVTSIRIKKTGGVYGTADVVIAFDELAAFDLARIDFATV